MSNETSQQAQSSLAKLNQRKARERLEKAGAQSTAALQRRVLALARERGLAPADIAKVMRQRVNVLDIKLFCEKHRVSYDWLLWGDLLGLQRMTQEARADRPDLTEAQRKELVSLFCALSPRNRVVALSCIQEMASGGGL